MLFFAPNVLILKPQNEVAWMVGVTALEVSPLFPLLYSAATFVRLKKPKALVG